MATTAPGHAAITDRQGRLTLTMIDDVTLTTTSTGTTSTLVFVSRLMSADQNSNTKIDQVVEIGTNGIVGGVAELGSYTGKFQRNDTSSKLLGLITGKHWVSGTQTWNYYDLSAAQFDYIRLLADPMGTVFSAAIANDAILTGAQFSQKSTGIATEEYDLQGPFLSYINGFPVGKCYNIVSGDVTAGYFSISGTLGTGEIPNPILPPASGQPPSGLYSNGHCSFFTVKRQLTAQATIGGVNYSTGQRVRYLENQPYQATTATMGTIGAQTCTLNILLANNTTQAYVGPELVVGATITVDIGGANQENCVLTAVTATTISFTTTKTHALTAIGMGLAPASGYILFNPLNSKFVCGDTLVTGDSWRYIFASYATASTPTTIGTSSLDTTDVPGVPGRVIPLTISAYQTPRVNSCDIKVSIDRKQVQGLGENQVIWGTAGVPKIDYSLDVNATDNVLLQALSTGSLAAGAGGDIFSTDYMARYMLANASPLTVTLKNPNNNAKTLKTYVGNLPVFGSISDTVASTSDESLKLSGQDFSGVLTITAYA